MVVCNVECVQKISEYLDSPVGEVSMLENNIVAAHNLVKDGTIEGFSTIVQIIAKNSKFNNALGRDKIELALVRQWLEYAAMCATYIDHPANSRRILKELNSAISGRSYFAGGCETVADVVLYYCLHSIMKGLTPQEKGDVCELSRWFDSVQQNSKLRQNMELIDLKLLRLYRRLNKK